MKIRGVFVVCALLVAAVAVALPGSAGATAVAGAEPSPGPSGLPDGRVYEQASPTNKFGAEAGASLAGTLPYIVAGVGGNEVAYFNTGPLGETPTGFDYFSIARRSAAGWQSRGAVSRGVGKQGAFRTNPQSGLGFSAEMTASVFGAPDVFVPEQAPSSPTPHLYRYNEDGTVQWIGKPAIVNPLKFEGFDGSYTGLLAGASPGYDAIYYAFEGVLTPEEEVRDPLLGNVSRAEEIETMNASSAPPVSNQGFYEWRDGALRYAGVLPNGYVDPHGAAPAATVDASDYSGEQLNNQVSEDGSKAFFVSPDPQSESQRPVELYVRETAADGSPKTVLVSRDLLLPQVEGEPASAPSGVIEGNGAKGDGTQGELNLIRASFIYASPDGSHVFFESDDQLTAEAPSGNLVKEYEFDTRTNTLTYLPGVADLKNECTNCSSPTSNVLVSSRDGSDFLFIREGKLDVWNGGAISEIGPLGTEFRESVTLARASATGSEFVFQTLSPLPAFKFNNGGGAYEQVYRYEVAGSQLECVSCPPTGTAPSGDARLSHALPSGNLGNTFSIITGNRGVSEDGSRIFFDTPDSLVAQDTNGERDVYEWENGVRYLVSTGVSTEESFFGDNSPSGNDVFFSTLEGLIPGDTDNGFDVYDARIPRPGDQLPPSAVPCEGAVCQGPPSVPNLLGAPASELFNGRGNLTVRASHRHTAKRKRERKARRGAGRCRSHTRNGTRKRRRRCTARHNATHKNGNRRHNRRGK